MKLDLQSIPKRTDKVSDIDHEQPMLRPMEVKGTREL